MVMNDKKYQNVSFEELMEYSKINPNRNQTLTSIEIQTAKNIEETSLDKLGLRGYKAYNLNPSGILSVVACINDSGNYSIMSKSARLQTISKLTTDLQTKSDILKNSHLSRKRKKIYDLIGSAYNNSKFETKEYIDLYAGIATILDIQFILMKSAEQEISESGEIIESGYKGEIHFSSNPENWKYDNPTWIADYHGRWVALPLDTHSKPLKKFIAQWITQIEQQGWLIQWPEVDATKTELVNKLSLLPTWDEKDKKLTKDVLSQRLGKANTIRVFTNWMMGKIDSIEPDD
jgi:hypothetical protein